MKLKRYYIEAELKSGNDVILADDEFHHMKNVMRTRVGDFVILFNGSEVEAKGEVIELNKTCAKIRIKDVYKNLSEPSVHLTLYQAVSKGEKLSLIMQKITELGASEMVVFYSDFTDIKDKTTKVDKLTRVSIAAAKQCGRSSLVRASGVISFDKMIELLKCHEKVFVAYENASGATLTKSLLKNSNLGNIAIVIGAEGGFSQKEIEKLENSGCEIVTLGKRILRTETAAIVSVAQILFYAEK